MCVTSISNPGKCYLCYKVVRWQLLFILLQFHHFFPISRAYCLRKNNHYWSTTGAYDPTQVFTIVHNTLYSQLFIVHISSTKDCRLLNHSSYIIELSSEESHSLLKWQVYSLCCIWYPYFIYACHSQSSLALSTLNWFFF